MANTIQKESKIIYLQIGQNYENLGVQKQFDVSEWAAEFPDAHIYLLFKRPGEEAAAPVNTTLDEDGVLTWTVSNWETGIIGIGFAEIRAIDSSTGLVKKSHVIPCSIEASVTDEDEAPDYPSWVDRMLQFGENVDSIYATLPQELEEGIASIQQEAQTQTEAIEQKGITTRASIPADYTTLSDDVTDLKSAVENVDDFIGNAYTWMDGYWALGNGAWTAQTGTVTYHSTDKIIGTIPALTDFFNGDYMSGDSFFAVWNGSTYNGYLMDGIWKRPNGTTYATPPVYDRYAIVLHNVADYENFRLRNLALVSELNAVDTVADKAEACSSLLITTKNVTNTADQSVQTTNGYFYAITKKVYLKEYIPPEYSSGTVYIYLQKLTNAGTYDTVKSKQLKPGETFYADMIVDIDYAIVLIFNTESPANQYFATVNNDDTFAMVQGWNSNTKKPVSTILQYYIPGTYVVYDPVTNYLLPYIDDGDPCNWKGTECSLFDNPLCIGDSITQGAPTPPDIAPDPSKATRTVVNQTMYSYPASMKKQWGVECTNWGISGASSQSWYDYYSVNEPSWSGHDAAIMLIGNNDYHLVDDLGGLTEETLPTAIQRSKAAMMSIITKLKADNADIKIFICTLLPGWDIGTTLSPYVCDNIRNIASTEENIYLIDLSKYSKVKGAPYSYGHPTALGYNQLAREIGGAIGYIINNKPEDFKWVQFIGTEYAMDGQ